MCRYLSKNFNLTHWIREIFITTIVIPSFTLPSVLIISLRATTASPMIHQSCFGTLLILSHPSTCIGRNSKNQKGIKSNFKSGKVHHPWSRSWDSCGYAHQSFMMVRINVLSIPFAKACTTQRARRIVERKYFCLRRRRRRRRSDQNQMHIHWKTWRIGIITCPSTERRDSYIVQWGTMSKNVVYHRIKHPFWRHLRRKRPFRLISSY